MNYIYKLNTIKRGYMQNLLLYIKNNLTPTLAQILLQAFVGGKIKFPFGKIKLP